VRPEKLIFLGDSFHDQEARSRIDDIDLAMLLEITRSVRTIWICGNHDPEPPADVGGAIVSEIALGPITLRHEPRLIIGENCEIAGHLHPAASVEQRGRRIRCRCFIADHRRIVMPAFGSYTGGLSVTAAPYEGLFESFEVFMIGAKAIHRIPGRRVR
jgi:DNA ligase-associated metallophosphoesterase